MNETKGSAAGGFLSWKIGQQPNVLLMYLGFCCCCGFPLMFQMHAFRNELKGKFDEIDDTLHWFNVIISIVGIYQNDKQLEELEAKYNVTPPPSSLPWWLPVFVNILWPLAIANQMKRLNAIVEAMEK